MDVVTMSNMEAEVTQRDGGNPEWKVFLLRVLFSVEQIDWHNHTRGVIHPGKFIATPFSSHEQ
jgi:hypothetical protein